MDNFITLQAIVDASESRQGRALQSWLKLKVWRVLLVVAFYSLTLTLGFQPAPVIPVVGYLGTTSIDSALNPEYGTTRIWIGM